MHILETYEQYSMYIDKMLLTSTHTTACNDDASRFVVNYEGLTAYTEADSLEEAQEQLLRLRPGSKLVESDYSYLEKIGTLNNEVEL